MRMPRRDNLSSLLDRFGPHRELGRLFADYNEEVPEEIASVPLSAPDRSATPQCVSAAPNFDTPLPSAGVLRVIFEASRNIGQL
jgi:hypothetical protein